VGEWDNAAADLVPQGIDAAPLDDTWLQLACLRVLKGDTAGYQQLCEQWLERMGQTKKSLTGLDAFRSSRTCMLHTAGGNDPAKGVSWAEEAVRTNPKCPWFLHCLALAHYRAGHFDQAIQWCDNSLKHDSAWGGGAQNWLLLGLTHKRLGQTQQASEWLDKAMHWRDGALTGKHEAGVAYPPDVVLSDWLEFQVLYREAETHFNKTEMNTSKEKP
jgi:tetratricopeptide (TPR) repeat protein